jgi:hypothetical protein
MPIAPTAVAREGMRQETITSMRPLDFQRDAGADLVLRQVMMFRADANIALCLVSAQGTISAVIDQATAVDMLHALERLLQNDRAPPS